jgi:F-type H+-transporting ATPase subunit epsilon
MSQDSENPLYKVDSLYVNVIIPEKNLYSHVAISATLPGLVGEFTILPDHAVLVSSLKSGVISLVTNQESAHKIFISSGFAQINKNNVNILVDHAYDITALKGDEIQNEIVLLNQKLQDPKITSSELSLKIINKKLAFLQEAQSAFEESRSI